MVSSLSFCGWLFCGEAERLFSVFLEVFPAAFELDFFSERDDFGATRKPKKEPQIPPAMWAMVETPEAEGVTNSLQTKTPIKRKKLRGSCFFSMVLMEVSKISIKASPLAPKSEDGMKQAFIIPVTKAVTVTMRAIMAEPYFSSMRGPRSRIKDRFPRRWFASACPSTWVKSLM